jgi:transposase
MVDTRLRVGSKFYNACLNEAFARSRKVRADPQFAAAKALPSGKDRTEAFRVLDRKFGFTDWAMMSKGSALRVAFLREHVPAQEAQLLARRAFTAVRRWHLGLNGKPRFRRTIDGLRSMAAKDPRGALRPKVVGETVVGFLWGRDHLLKFAEPATTGRKGREQQAEWAQVRELILSGKVLSSMIVRTIVHGKATYRANLTVDGPRPKRHPVGTGIVSVDMGPSTVAVVDAVLVNGVPVPTGARLVPLAPNLPDTAKQMRRLQRRYDRAHRAGSPACFDAAGQHVHSSCLWTVRSQASDRVKAQLAETARVRTAYRKTSHNQTVNQLLAVGSTLHAEKLNYVGWQKLWSKSVHDRAPGMFVEACRSKAESAGGNMFEYSTFTTALSQTCVCGSQVKKPLSLRVHRCACGVIAQRDLFSAFLGLFVHRQPNPDRPEQMVDTLDLDDARTAWSAAQDIEWMPKSENKKSSSKRRGQVRPSGRSMARITARRASRRAPTETLGINLVQVVVTADAAL